MSIVTHPAARSDRLRLKAPWAFSPQHVRIGGAAVSGVAVGTAIGLHPSAALLVVVIGAAGLFCAIAPVRYLPGMLLVGTIVEPTLVLKGVGGAGQAHLVIAVAVVALVRVLIARPQLTVPGVFPLAVAAAVGLALLSALVAAGRPAGQVGSISELVRDLSFPFAAVVGLVGATHARDSGRALLIPRAFAFLGIAASLVCVDYWVWAKYGSLPLSSSLFNDVKTGTQFPGSRSVFPWVEDAPNIGAVTFVMIGAFAAPPLLLAPHKRDRLVGALLVITSMAAVLATESRTGIVAAATGSVAYLVLVGRGGGRRSRVLAILLLAAAVSGYVFSTFPSDRASVDTLSARTYIWEQAARSFLDEPIIGHGYLYSKSGNFVEASAKDGTTTSRTQSTHSDVLSNLVDGGVIGLAIFACILLMMARAALRGFGDRRSIPIAIGFSCLLVTFITGGVDNTLTQSAAPPTILWLTFGVMVGLTPMRPGSPHGPERQPKPEAPGSRPASLRRRGARRPRRR